jgi:hypothetical protein
MVSLKIQVTVIHQVTRDLWPILLEISVKEVEESEMTCQVQNSCTKRKWSLLWSGGN